ncbi:C3 and PZP-like alpha-2-macroglobulin domain-containing protein 8 isoform X5 [Vulpes vulpes]|uniref:C3 and PZP-like alpha-2-macroglobulin domain-containing protein 8 isoform X5 n=1 Tax=Vulpes vulpes TaxID=9627 RepID=A0ABM4XH67_VULVU
MAPCARRGGCEQRAPGGAGGAAALGPRPRPSPGPAPSLGAAPPRSRKMRGALLCPLLRLLLVLRSPRDGVSAAPQAPPYLIAAPSVFRSGVEEVISVTIFNSPREVMVQAQLVAQGEAVAWSQGAILDKGTIKLKVPTGLRGQALLQVWGRSQQAEEGPLFHNQTSVTVDSRGASVFIQTDKPVYKPQHRVLIRIFTVTPDLRPVSEKLEAYILDPRGSRMTEWRHLEPLCCGVANMTFPLSDQPVLGEWFIFVEMQGHVYNKSFEVQKYVLPKFELLIDPPQYIRDLDTCEKGTVQARYTFGKPVSGNLTINMTVNGVGYYSQEVGRPILRTTKIHGSEDFDICVKDMIPADVPEHFRGTVSIWATVISVDGSQQVAFDDSTPVQRQLVDVRYSKDTRKQFKPGLSYVGKVELSYPDGSPAEGVTVQIRAELTPKDNIYTTESVSQGGLVVFEIPFIPMSAQHVWLETKVTALQGKPVGAQYLPSYLSLSSWYSPSQCYLQLQPPPRPLQVGREAHFPVKSTCPCNFTLYYEVASRGNIVLSGQQPAHITQQRSRRSATETPIRLMHLSETEPPPAAAAEVNVCVTSLRLPVTPSMVPLGRLLVFYVRENGEGVADNLQFAVENFFENQVSLTYSANETQPGEVVDLRVRAARGSCVCITAVDKSIYLLRSGFQLTPAQSREEEKDLLPRNMDLALSQHQVYVKISVPKGIRFVGHPGKRHLTKKMCVASGETEPAWVVLSFSDLGISNVTAKALAYGETSCCRDGQSIKHAEESFADRRVPTGRDHIRRSVMVEPEGAPRAYTYSVFFCPSERVHISTPNKYEFQYVQRPLCLTRFDVAVRAHNDARVALSAGPQDTAGMIEIVLGGHQNTRSWISTSKMGDPVASTHTAKILSWDEFRTFWISWHGGFIQVGHGPEPSNESVIMAWTLPRPPEVRFIGFSTGWGSMGEFRIWKKVEVDESYSEAFTLGVPHSAIPGSERAVASVIGDVMGPTLNHLSNLLRLPFGCGEQNMIHFAPNIFVLKYLQKTRQLSSEVEQETTDYLVQGYQRQLTYRHRDGSYSAFGERDASGSMWLTAFVLKSFAQARSFIFIDPQELEAAKGWIVRQQRADGSFPAVGRILNKDIQGGIHGTVPLTAYVVAALLETGMASEEERSAIARARHFLESSAPLAADPYSSALTTYALTLLRSPAAPAALRKLRSLAITQDGVTHWSLTGSRDIDKDAFLSFSDGVSQSVVSAEVEMTAYALLTYTLLGDVATALPVVKWLSQQRNALGGFSSTQDTCVALQALAEYAILSYAGSINLTVSLASTNLDYQETFELHRANQKVLQTAAIPSLPTGLFVSAKGEGCCLMQIDVTYHVPDPVAKPAFQLSVSLQEPEAKQRQTPAPAASADDDDPAADQHQQEYQVTLEVCTRWLHAGSSNMAVLEVPLLSGFRVDIESLEQLLFDKHFTLKRYEVAGRRVLFYFDEIPSRCLTCVRFRALREHVVGRTSALPVSVYDYYEPAFEATRFYNVSSRSPLARELCAGPACNEVERAPAQGPGWSPGERGPAAAPEEGAKILRCGCARDCSARGDPVCGSNGVVYTSACHLQEAACLGRVRLEPAPPGRCALEQLTPASASYSYDYDPVPPDSGHLAASHGHEVMDLEGEAEDSQSGFSS